MKPLCPLCFGSSRRSQQNSYAFLSEQSILPLVFIPFKNNNNYYNKDIIFLGREKNKKPCYLEITFFSQSHINCYAFNWTPRMRGKGKIEIIISAYSLVFLSPSGCGGRGEHIIGTSFLIVSINQ